MAIIEVVDEKATTDAMNIEIATPGFQMSPGTDIQFAGESFMPEAIFARNNSRMNLRTGLRITAYNFGTSINRDLPLANDGYAHMTCGLAMCALYGMNGLYQAPKFADHEAASSMLTHREQLAFAIANYVFVHDDAFPGHGELPDHIKGQVPFYVARCMLNNENFGVVLKQPTDKLKIERFRVMMTDAVTSKPM